MAHRRQDAARARAWQTRLAARRGLCPRCASDRAWHSPGAAHPPAPRPRGCVAQCAVGPRCVESYALHPRRARAAVAWRRPRGGLSRRLRSSSPTPVRRGKAPPFVGLRRCPSDQPPVGSPGHLVSSRLRRAVASMRSRRARMAALARDLYGGARAAACAIARARQRQRSEGESEPMPRGSEPHRLPSGGSSEQR
jgi:hypothetical protein